MSKNDREGRKMKAEDRWVIGKQSARRGGHESPEKESAKQAQHGQARASEMGGGA
jgi:hypothetical protein